MPGGDEPAAWGPVSAAQAQSIVRGLRPLPWPSAYGAAARLMEKETDKKGITSYFLTSGVKDRGEAKDLLRVLQSGGRLIVKTPQATQTPLLLRLRPDEKNPLAVIVEGPAPETLARPVRVEALARDGTLIDVQTLKSVTGERQAGLAFALPAPLAGKVAMLRLNGAAGAGGTILLDDILSRRQVALVTGASDKAAPLSDPLHYIRQALGPAANLSEGALAPMLAAKPDAIILADMGTLPPGDLNALESWIKSGGLLIRFAGPRMTQNLTQGDMFLTPVALRKGNRALDGALTWEKPARLAPFDKSSPFFGLDIPADIVVNRQLLAEPDQDLAGKVWGALDDGTPLVTASALERGMIVLFHTTATPEWSNLALSGLFPGMLARAIRMAGASVHDRQAAATGALPPLSVLDGFGQSMPPPATAQPLPADAGENFIPASRHPPGLYGRGGWQRALNLGDALPLLEDWRAVPAGTAVEYYGSTAERDLRGPLLAAALLLFLIDWLVMLLMGVLAAGFFARRAPAALIFALLLLPALPAYAQDNAAPAHVRYASQIHMAYIRTGNPAVDDVARAGLESLRQTLIQRTSVEPAGTVGLDPERDDLSFFPLIYWPVTAGQETLEPRALANIQYYLDHGGTVLIDTRDQISVPSGYGEGGGSNAGTLRRLLAGLDIPPLMAMPADHVLTKSFYLLRSVPGRYDGRTLWIEENSAGGRDGVSSVIIGGNDWAGAWAQAGGGAVTQNQEYALRFGVNLMMYALTGNYKADQVHLPHILERLGQ